MARYSLGYSPCPNDTFIFYALVHGLIDSEVLLQNPVLEDVETLNNWAMTAKLDITKLSFHALGHVVDDYCVLSSGSALGRGCGPLLITAEKDTGKTLESMKVAIPGKYTTAAMLFRMFAPQCTGVVEMQFDRIMGSVERGEVDAGVIIHESRFTYRNFGLKCIQDLGLWWEETSGLPIPLGCIAVRRSLGHQIIAGIDDSIRKSLEFSLRHPEKSLDYIRTHSQEIDEKVVQAHIGLYVNEFSLHLGKEGLLAVESFLRRGREIGILPQNRQSILF